MIAQAGGILWAVMAIATVRLAAWSDQTGPGFEVKFDPSGITATASDSGCVIEILLEVSPGWQGHAFPSLLAVHGILKLDASQAAGVEVSNAVVAAEQ